MTRRELRRRVERRVGIVHAVMRFVAAAQSREDLHRFFDRRLVDRNLLQPPRQRAVLLDVLELLERRRSDDAQIAGGEHRLDQRREIHRAAGCRAGADRGVHLVDEEDRLRPRGAAPRSTALNRSSKSPRKRVPASSAPVSSAKTSASFNGSWTIVAGREQPRRETFGHRRLADAGLADEHRIVLAAAAQHFDGPLQFSRRGRSADRAVPGARGRSG